LRRSYVLILAVLCSALVMLAATVVAHAGGPTEVYGWVPQRELSQSGGDASRGPHVAVHQDRIHVMWTDDSQGQSDPYYVRSLDLGTSWSLSERISTGRPSADSTLSVGSGGAVHACWWDDMGGTPREFGLMCARRTATGWSLQPSVVITRSDIKGPSLAVTGGYIHVVWSNKQPAEAYDLWYSSKQATGGTWSEPVVVLDTGPGSLYAKMVADGNGNLHVVWQEDKDYDEVMYITGTVESGQATWHAPVTLTQSIAPSATSPDIAVGEDGTVQAVFGVDVPGLIHWQDLYLVSFPLSSTEGISPTIIPDSRVFISQQLPNYASPSLFVRQPSTVHVLWNGKTEEDLWDRIYYARSDDGGANWSAVVPVSRDDAWSDGFPDVVATGEMVHVVFQQETPLDDNDVYYSRKLPFVSQFILVMKDYQ
jgi:hypothetical protein